MKRRSSHLFGIGATALTVVCVLVLTLYPYDFTTPMGEGELVAALSRRPRVTDAIRNVLLFVPLGIGLGSLAVGSMGRIAAWSAGLAATIECLQVFLPRSASWVDVVANVTGAMIGAAVWRAGAGRFSWFLGKKKARVRRRSVGAATAVWLAYVVLAIGVSAALQRPPRLEGWDPRFPLLVGNEASGDRPWHGTVSSLLLASEALEPEVAGSLLSGRGSTSPEGGRILAVYRPAGDVLRDSRGVLPDLRARGGEIGVAAAGASSGDTTAGRISAGRWLGSERGALSGWVKAVSASQEFTVGVAIAGTEGGQTGPARIVSQSISPSDRNLTLGQEGDDLVIRARVGWGDGNGRSPEILVREVFASPGPYSLLATWSRGTMTVRASTLAAPVRHELTLAQVLTSRAFRLLLLDNSLPPRSFEFLYFFVVFLPVGVLLAPVVNGIEYRRRRTLVGLAGLACPALGTSIAALAYVGEGLPPDILLFCVGIAAGGMSSALLAKKASARSR